MSLSTHASQVSQDNLKLRKELFDLIRQNKVLQQREATLKTQNAVCTPRSSSHSAHLTFNQQLLRQCELNDGISTRRDSRLGKA